MKKIGSLGLGLGLDTQSLGLGLGLEKKVLVTSLHSSISYTIMQRPKRSINRPIIINFPYIAPNT